MVRTIEEFKVSMIKRIFDFILVKILRVKNQKFLGQNLHYFNGKKIKVERSPEPSDIFWENLNIKPYQRCKRVTLTYILTFIVLLLCLGVNIAIFYIKIEI